MNMHRSRYLVGLSLLALPVVAFAAPARNPQIVKLAKAALACPFQDGDFSEDCAAFKAWSENDALFTGSKGNDTILSMLADADIKVRVLATSKGFDDAKTYFAVKGRAAQLFAIAAKETDPGVARNLASSVTWVDAEKLGLGKELLSLAKHPIAEFRRGLAGVVSRYQSPAVMAVLKMLLADTDRDVQKSAIHALSTGGITPGVEPVCTLLAKQLQRTDNLIGDALWTGSSSKCNGMDKLVVDELVKRTANPSKVTNAVGIGYALAAEGVCRRTKASRLKKQGFAIGKKLTDRKLLDPNTRRAGLDVLVECDREQAATLLTALAKDKDKFVAKAAAEKLAGLKKK